MTRASLFRLALAAGGASAALAACQPRPSSSTLQHPDEAELTRAAPDSFDVAFATSKGRFVVRAVRSWAPNGVDRFHYLAGHGFYDGARFFRVLPNFVVQFGIKGVPAVDAAWENRAMPDDPATHSNDTGTVTFATSGPNSRTTQLFINLRDNHRLDAMGFAPIGRVVEGMDVVRSLWAGYGEGQPQGSGPDQDRLTKQGNTYLDQYYPLLDSIKRATILQH